MPLASSRSSTFDQHYAARIYSTLPLTAFQENFNFSTHCNNKNPGRPSLTGFSLIAPVPAQTTGASAVCSLVGNSKILCVSGSVFEVANVLPVPMICGDRYPMHRVASSLGSMSSAPCSISSGQRKGRSGWQAIAPR